MQKEKSKIEKIVESVQSNLSEMDYYLALKKTSEEFKMPTGEIQRIYEEALNVGYTKS